MPKILIATGGTGGHLFPAQSLAQELAEKGYEVVFAGGGLSQNRYFKRNLFTYKEVACAPLSLKKGFYVFYKMLKGIMQSLKILKQFKPDVVIGFGSFYTFPIMAAAVLTRVPIIIFEPNAYPGKVSRLFSKFAQVSAVQFVEAARYLKGYCCEVKLPQNNKKRTDTTIAREYFYLAPDRLTILVFGGSQGAESINHYFSKAIEKIELSRERFQVIHITGRSDSAELIRRCYESLNIRACVKVFEERMDLAWSATDIAVCRSGAATLAEQLSYAVPAILIPFPRASDDHQMKNAIFIKEQVQGAVVCSEQILKEMKLQTILNEFLDEKGLINMRNAINRFNRQEKKDFSSVVCEFIGQL